MTDQELIANGNISGLYRRYKRPLMSFVCKQGTPFREAEDVVQDTFIRVLRYIDYYDPDGASVKTWLFTIAKNKARGLNMKKHRGKRIPPGALSSIEAKEDDEESKDFTITSDSRPDTALEQKDGKAALRRILQDLDCFGQVVIYRDLIGYTYEEIQSITGLPLGTIKSRIHRGRKKVQDYAA